MKRIITVATTGAWPMRKDNPNIPMTPEEIASDVVECYHAGAAIAHLHMRDSEEKGTMNLDLFRRTVELIRAQCDILINLTTSGDLDASDEERQIHLKELKPDLASYDCGSMNWGHNSLFINSPQFLESLAKTMYENGVKPEVEIFDAGMLYTSLHYLKNGVLKEPLHYQFVLGAAGGTAATVENLVHLKSILPQNCTWSAFGIGKGHMPIMLATLSLGGHLRVGMEDNLRFDRTRLANSNLEFVERAVDLVKLAGYEVATPEDAREILSI